MSIYDIPLKTLGGEDSSLGTLAGKTLLVVNVASKCGLTPQYTALEELHARLAPPPARPVTLRTDGSVQPFGADCTVET